MVFSPQPIGGGEMPSGGMCLITADILREGPSRTRHVRNEPTMGHGEAVDTFRDWLEGTPSGCPDF